MKACKNLRERVWFFNFKTSISLKLIPIFIDYVNKELKEMLKGTSQENPSKNQTNTTEIKHLKEKITDLEEQNKILINRVSLTDNTLTKKFDQYQGKTP